MSLKKTVSAKEKEAASFSCRWKQGAPDYLCNPQFLNTVPPVQAGPFFKKINITHDFEEFAEYHLSSLEKNYVWRPHIDAARCLDIIDQETLLATNKDLSVDAVDLRGSKSSSGRINTVDVPWLRKTTYLTNNLYDNVYKFKGSEEIVKGYKKKAIQEIGGQYIGPFVPAGVEKSFAEIEKKTVQSLEADPENAKKGSIEWMCPILPDDVMWDHELSFLTFDKDPGSDGPNDVSLFSTEKICSSIVTNIRAIKLPDGSSQQSKFAVSLVVADNENNGEVKDGEPIVYSWVRDFRMDIKKTNVDDTYLFTVEDEGTPEARVCFVPIRARLDLKRLPKEDCTEHTAAVKRRLAASAEESATKKLRSELAPLRELNLP